jgi:hypothetical protein
MPAEPEPEGGIESPRSRVIAAPGTGEETGAIGAQEPEARLVGSPPHSSAISNQKSCRWQFRARYAGVPMADRPSVLLKGSGR